MLIFNWSTLTSGLPFYERARKALPYLIHALYHEAFVKSDYLKLVKLTVFFLGGVIENFRFLQAATICEARFMVDALYILTTQMIKVTLKMLTFDEEETFKDV